MSAVYSSPSNDKPRAGKAPIRVLVPEAHAVGMLGVIRSLGAAGYEVHACAAAGEALGFRSRFAARSTVCPGYTDEAFISWLREYIARHAIRAILPSEALLCAIRCHFDEFAPLIPVSADPDVVYGAIGKFSVFERLLATPGTADHLPPMLLVRPGDPAPAPDEIEALGLPVFIKADAIHSLDGDGDEVHRIDRAAEGIERVEALRQRYSRVSVQGFVPGRGAGVYLLRWDAEVRLEFMNTCEHEVPHTGGFCSLRTSFRNDAMLADAKAKLDALGWQGIAMLEYRWDESEGRFWLIEVNARFWAALHLALFAGVDFPRRLLDAHFGRDERADFEYRTGIRARLTVPFEVTYVQSCLSDSGLPIARRVWTIVEFFLLFLDPRLHSDLLYPGDRKLYWIQWGRSLRRWLTSLTGTIRQAVRGGRVGAGERTDQP